MENAKKTDTWPNTWIVTEGMAGTENQCLGVTEALGLSSKTFRTNLKFPWNYLSPWLGFECASTFTEPLDPPWPDLLICSGRKSIAAARYIKKKSEGRTFVVQIQDPRVNPKQFDMVALPAHDPTRGDNVFVTTATPNRITAEKLAVARAEWASTFAQLPGPRIAVLIGGSTKRHHMTSLETQQLVRQLSPLRGLMITTSRRTGETNNTLLKRDLTKPENFFWDRAGPNPYMGMLAWADFILVTADSTSMISEAATTGKPVYVLPMPGLTRRQQLLVDNLKKHGAVRDFDGKFEPWTYPPLADSAAIAAAIRQKSGLFAK